MSYLLYKIKQTINHETMAGMFAFMSFLTIRSFWYVSIIIMAMALIFWWNPGKKSAEWKQFF